MIQTDIINSQLPFSDTDGHHWRAAELFAGVGGFRLGLEKAGCSVVWSNQWEPSTKQQHGSDCYIDHFGTDGHVCDDISTILDKAEAGQLEIPDHELLVGGFPCQDYSVATTLTLASGIQGRKGILWWQIYRFLLLKKPPYIFLENVDRLLKSPADQRGRDFAIMLSSLNDLGYTVEWRVINAADYGLPQRRRRVFLVGWLDGKSQSFQKALSDVTSKSILAKAFPAYPATHIVDLASFSNHMAFHIGGPVPEVSGSFGKGLRTSPFHNAGIAWDRKVLTMDLLPQYDGECKTLADILQKDSEIDASFFIPESQLEEWRYLKGAKRERRVSKRSGYTYYYTEGAISFPDSVDRPSRTILTGEGGSSPSRFKHIIQTSDGRFRRLTPVELERLNGFPDEWTANGIRDTRRAFLMGNALVVDLITRVASKLLSESSPSQTSSREETSSL